MPYISTKTTVAISSKQRESIKTKLGKAIEIIPGKSEQWLMLSFEDESNMYFQGRNNMPIAYVEVKSFGKAPEDAYCKFTKAVCDILKEELEIESDYVYVKYEEVSHWGWNGKNF
jgi:hypothetical protein